MIIHFHHQNCRNKYILLIRALYVKKALALIGSAFKYSNAYICLASSKPSISITACNSSEGSKEHLLRSIASANRRMLEATASIASWRASELRGRFGICLIGWARGGSWLSSGIWLCSGGPVYDSVPSVSLKSSELGEANDVESSSQFFISGWRLPSFNLAQRLGAW